MLECAEVIEEKGENAVIERAAICVDKRLVLPFNNVKHKAR